VRRVYVIRHGSRSCINTRFQEIVGYLERQYDDILAEESRIKRNPRFRDNRVHALLYFIPPTGHA
jgi:cell division control protein 11